MLGIKTPTNFNPYVDNCGCVVAVAGDDYALIGGDTRLSSSKKETLIHTRHQKKLFLVSSLTVLGASGCWADVLTFTRLVTARANCYRLEHGKELSTPAAAQMLSTMLYCKRFFPFFIANVIAGLDQEGKGCVYGFDPLGHIVESKYCAAGSATAQLQPVMDSMMMSDVSNMQNVQVRSSLPKYKAIALIKDLFICAAERDTHTGDSMDLMIVTADGIEEEQFDLRKD